MEPGHEDREYMARHYHDVEWVNEPQWSPVMKTGNTRLAKEIEPGVEMPQWSPVMKTGNTWVTSGIQSVMAVPQWSPVMKTGNT